MTRYDNSNNDDFDRILRDYRALPPEQRDLMVRRVIARARAYRTQAIRDLLKQIREMIGRLYQWMKQRAAIARLRRLDDRMLKDIGITRGEIESAVLGFPQDRTRARRTAPSCAAKRTSARVIDKAA